MSSLSVNGINFTNIGNLCFKELLDKNAELNIENSEIYKALKILLEHYDDFDRTRICGAILTEFLRDRNRHLNNQ